VTNEIVTPASDAGAPFGGAAPDAGELADVAAAAVDASDASDAAVAPPVTDDAGDVPDVVQVAADAGVDDAGDAPDAWAGLYCNTTNGGGMLGEGHEGTVGPITGVVCDAGSCLNLPCYLDGLAGVTTIACTSNADCSDAGRAVCAPLSYFEADGGHVDVPGTYCAI
jgi:hypothetical protein